MAWDRHKLLLDGNGTDKYVPWTTLSTTPPISNCLLFQATQRRILGGSKGPGLPTKKGPPPL